LRHGRLAHQERTGDLGGGQPAHHPQGQRDLRLPGERRVAAGEDQPQPLLWVGLDRPLQLRQLGAVVAFAPQGVQAAAAGDGEQPGVRSLGDPFHRPVPQGGHHGVLDQILGGREVAGHPHQRGGQLARVLAYHAGQLGMRPIRHEGS
jgi:hypothetical protein